jgi:hypothetical protein
MLPRLQNRLHRHLFGKLLRMQNDRYTRVLLTMIAVALVFGTARPFFESQTVVKAQTLQAPRSGSTGRAVWEYKIVYRQRPFNTDRAKIEELGEAGDWVMLSDDGKKYSATELESKFAELGDAGWELVAVEARSDHAITNLQGRTATCAGNFCNDTAILAGLAANGATSSDVWIFKRRKN